MTVCKRFTSPLNRIEPVPAVRVRSSPARPLPVKSPSKATLPMPKPVFNTTLPVKVVALGSAVVKVMVSFVVVTFPAVRIPFVPVSVTAPSEVILAPAVIVSVSDALKVTIPPVRPDSVFTVLFKAIVVVVTFNPAVRL